MTTTITIDGQKVDVELTRTEARLERAGENYWVSLDGLVTNSHKIGDPLAEGTAPSWINDAIDWLRASRLW